MISETELRQDPFHDAGDPGCRCGGCFENRTARLGREGCSDCGAPLVTSEERFWWRCAECLVKAKARTRRRLLSEVRW